MLVHQPQAYDLVRGLEVVPNLTLAANKVKSRGLLSLQITKIKAHETEAKRRISFEKVTYSIFLNDL